jgi:hypothetical protein
MMTVLDLLYKAPESLVPTLQVAFKATCAGDWKTASRQLGYAAEAGYTQFHQECGDLADEFHKKADRWTA